MSLSSLPPELLLSVFRAYAPEVDRTWLASVTTLCKTLKPIVESVLYREVTIISGEGFRTFCHSVASDSSRSAAVRKLALVFHLNDTSPVDIIPRSTFLSLINLDWLKLDMDDPSYLASLVDAPFRLRSLLVMTWHYHSSFEDVIASQHSLKTLTIDFGQDIEHVQASRLDIPCNVRALLVISCDFSAFCSRFRLSNLTHLSLLIASHDDIQAFSMLAETLVSIKLSQRIEDTCALWSCIWPSSVLRHTRWPKLKYLEVRHGWWRYKEYSEATVASGLRERCPELRRLVWDPDCSPICRCNLHRPLDYSQGSRSGSLLSEYATMLLDRLPTLDLLFVVRHAGEPVWGERSGWVCSNVFKHTSEGSVVATTCEVLYSDNEWASITDDEPQSGEMRPARYT